MYRPSTFPLPNFVDHSIVDRREASVSRFIIIANNLNHLIKGVDCIYAVLVERKERFRER